MRKGVKFLIICIAIICFSCVNEKKTNQQVELISEVENNDCVFSCDLKNTQVIWSGYKTTDKIKVTGQFKRFKSSKIQKKNEYESIQNLIEGLDFTIDVGSSFSSDEIRDDNLKNFFFKLFAKNLVIDGKFGKLEQDSVNVVLKLFGQERRFKLNAYYESEIIHIKGHVDIIDQLGAKKAFESISQKCFDLHKGPDGISKTWQDVEIYIKAPIIKVCN